MEMLHSKKIISGRTLENGVAGGGHAGLSLETAAARHLEGSPPSWVRGMRQGPRAGGGSHLSSSRGLHPPSKRYVVDL